MVAGQVTMDSLTMDKKKEIWSMWDGKMQEGKRGNREKEGQTNVVKNIKGAV